MEDNGMERDIWSPGISGLCKEINFAHQPLRLTAT
jgi:hypothetical protein